MRKLREEIDSELQGKIIVLQVRLSLDYLHFGIEKNQKDEGHRTSSTQRDLCRARKANKFLSSPIGQSYESSQT